MNYNMYQKHEIEIDLKEALWELISQWKAILIASLVMALLFCGTKHIKDMRSYNAKIDAQKQISEQESLSVDERIDKALKAVPEEERSAVEHIVREKEWIERQTDYLKESILMTDPTRQRALCLLFDVRATSESNTEALKQSIMMHTHDDVFVAAIKEVIDPNIADEYIEELITIDSTEKTTGYEDHIDGMISTRIILPEDADADVVTEVICNDIDNYSQKEQSKYPHTLTFVETEDSLFYNTQAVNTKQGLINNINNLETNIKNAQNTLSEAQKAAISAIIAIKRESALAVESKEDMPDELAVAKKEAAVGDDELKAPGFSKKYSLFGFILGAFIYAVIYVTLLALKGNVGSAAGVQRYTGARILGEVYCDGGHTGLGRLFHSSSVERYHYLGKTDCDEQKVRVSESLEAVCVHTGTKELTLLDLAGTSRVGNTAVKAKEVIAWIREDLAGKGLKVDLIDVSLSKNFNEKKLLNTDNAVLVISADTRVALLDNMISLCEAYDIKMLGSVFMTQI